MNGKMLKTVLIATCVLSFYNHAIASTRAIAPKVSMARDLEAEADMNIEILELAINYVSDPNAPIRNEILRGYITEDHKHIGFENTYFDFRGVDLLVRAIKEGKLANLESLTLKSINQQEGTQKREFYQQEVYATLFNRILSCIESGYLPNLKSIDFSGNYLSDANIIQLYKKTAYLLSKGKIKTGFFQSF